MKDWKFKVGTADCDRLWDELADEINLPFIPRRGEIYYATIDCCEKLSDIIYKCWTKRKCKNCPFFKGNEKENDLDMNDAIWVIQIAYDVHVKEVHIYLSFDAPKL
jgi:hypothetical protein